ncbi:hypothetical protein pb186bvf_008265 [Paramecium bursaria]
MIDNYCRSHISQLPNIQKQFLIYDNTFDELKQDIGRFKTQAKESLLLKEQQIKDQIEKTNQHLKEIEVIMAMRQGQRADSIEGLNSQLHKISDTQSSNFKQNQNDIGRVEKKTMAYCVRIDEKCMGIQQSLNKSLIDNQEQSKQHIDKFGLQIQGMKISIEQINSEIKILKESLNTKCDQFDLKMIENNMENYLKKQELQNINQMISTSLNPINENFKATKQEIERLKTMINKLDYDLLQKATKMDFQISKEENQRQNKQIDDFKLTIQSVLSDFLTIENQLKENLIKLSEKIQRDVVQEIKVLGKNSVDDIIKQTLAKYDIVGMFGSHEKILHLIETKADQSQIAELMQSKASTSHFYSLQHGLLELRRYLKQAIDSNVLYYEAQQIDNNDSVNLKRSDMCKALQQLKNLLHKFLSHDKPVSRQQTSSSMDQRQNVKLRPTLYRTQQFHKRLKTEKI